MPKKKKKKKTATATANRKENRFEVHPESVTVIGRWDEETQSVILVEALLTDAAIEEVDKLTLTLTSGADDEQCKTIAKRFDTLAWIIHRGCRSGRDTRASAR